MLQVTIKIWNRLNNWTSINYENRYNLTFTDIKLSTLSSIKTCYKYNQQVFNVVIASNNSIIKIWNITFDNSLLILAGHSKDLGKLILASKRIFETNKVN